MPKSRILHMLKACQESSLVRTAVHFKYYTALTGGPVMGGWKSDARWGQGEKRDKLTDINTRVGVNKEPILF